ncbi:helix-turn-helix domain-containing protein [Mesorhizobium sp. ES1-4]|uniref:helix-turn-helix domain-containing protein n=1 Tax=Mesorhizobium sp. ES1-4 TaxID=2876627 RepID=UPI001CCEB51E|nr:AraC family transcriptional regulator [Mesorhizobium sp. ES1-4]MBZ9799212.1 AraC family transcriptional regulator [Mesorhizobium sp. ES1-4]
MTGVTVEIAHLHGPSSDPEDLRSTLPRLTVILEQIGGHAEMGLTPHRLAPLPVAGYRAASHLTFVPADTPLWQLAQRFRYIRRLVIDFDLSVLAATFGDALTLASCVEPRLMFRDSGILALAELLADACLGSGTDCRLYGDSLALAMSYKLFGADRARRNRGGLAPSQLRRVIALLEQSLPNAVALKDLAELTGLSEAYFSRAFKASTGMPPQRWRVAAKVQRAQTLLVETGDSLAAIALACGFADQSHFSRAFQTIAGASPGAWRKRHCV